MHCSQSHSYYFSEVQNAYYDEGETDQSWISFSVVENAFLKRISVYYDEYFSNVIDIFLMYISNGIKVFK